MKVQWQVTPYSSGGSGYSQQENPNDDDCATRQGIVIAGIEWLYKSLSQNFGRPLPPLLLLPSLFTLWTSNEKMWRITRQATKATRRAANAARKSADVAEAALTVAERPYLVPKEPKLRIWRFGQPGMPAPMWNPAEYVGTVEYGVVNRGRTVAFLKEATVCLIFAKSLPTVPDYRAGFEGKNNSERFERLLVILRLQRTIPTTVCHLESALKRKSTPRLWVVSAAAN